MITRRYVVSGRVQGVGFRWFTKQSADRHGVRGWVRNLSDGSVEVEATGSEGILGSFENDLRTGPAHSRVDDMTRHTAAPGPPASSFEILADA